MEKKYFFLEVFFLYIYIYNKKKLNKINGENIMIISHAYSVI